MSLRSRMTAAERMAATIPPPVGEEPSLTDRIEALTREYEADPGKFARDYDAFCGPRRAARH